MKTLSFDSIVKPINLIRQYAQNDCSNNLELLLNHTIPFKGSIDYLERSFENAIEFLHEDLRGEIKCAYLVTPVHTRGNAIVLTHLNPLVVVCDSESQNIAQIRKDLANYYRIGGFKPFIDVVSVNSPIIKDYEDVWITGYKVYPRG